MHVSRSLLRHAALAMSLAAILVVTLRPTGTRNELQLRPFAEIWSALTGTGDPSLGVQAIGNLLLFVPFGAALAMREVRWRTIGAVACALSGSIEVAQLFVPGRTSAVDDVMLNVAGAIVGNLAWHRLHARAFHRH